MLLPFPAELIRQPTTASPLWNRITDAEKAIASRTTELGTSGAHGEMEWQAIEDAVNGLSILKREIRDPMRIQAIETPLSNSGGGTWNGSSLNSGEAGESKP